MAKYKITQTMPYDSPGILVLWYQISREILTGSSQTGAPNKGGVGFRSAIFDQYFAISQKHCKIGT